MESGITDSWLLVVDGILLLWTLQADGDLLLGLLDLVVFAESLEPRHEHLDAHFAVGYAVKTGLSIFVGLQFETILLLLATSVHRMQHHARRPYRLAVVILEHQELK